MNVAAGRARCVERVAQGPITSGSVIAKSPSAASTSAISVAEVVNCPSERRQVGRRRQREGEAERAEPSVQTHAV